MLNLTFIALTNFLSFAVHSGDISLVPLAQFVHFPDQVVSLVCKLI